MDVPLIFEPLAMERVWGGRALETLFGKSLPEGVPVGELWELADREGAQSIEAASGRSLHSLWTENRAEVFGAKHLGHPSPRFPVLVKILDARERLSLQVHPPAVLAASLGGEPKTEVWYFARAEPGASICAGLRRGVTRERFGAMLADGTVGDAVHELPVTTGDSILIPSGRIHAIGGGNVVFEIQQNSDTTYRVFDWNRAGLDGKPRALHIEESLASTDFEDIEPAVSHAVEGVIAECPFFRVEKLRLEGPRVLAGADDFAFCMVAGGSAKCAGRSFGPGAGFLIPAFAWSLEVAGPALVLRITLPVQSAITAVDGTQSTLAESIAGRRFGG